MNITYSLATKEDAYGITYVSAHSWKETYTGLLPDDYLNNRIKNIENKVKNTEKFLESYKGKYIVAKDDEKVIGILAYSNSESEKYKNYGHLGALYILKEYQGFGIGKELFRIAIKGLIDMGYSKMYLECMQGNDTINFYEKYLGEIKEKISYPIKDACSVMADVVVFGNLEEVLVLVNEKKYS